MGTPQVRRHADDLEDNDELYDTRLHTSTRRYRSSAPLQADTLDEPDIYREKRIQRRRTSPTVQKTHALPSHTTTSTRVHRRVPLTSIGVGMVLMVLLFIGLRAFFSWWQVYQDDQHYGRPRTSQLDAVVGHADSPANPTHFIFINLHRHVEIIEMPGGDPAHTRIFTGPILFGDGQDLTPVTGEIRDDHGKRDLVVHIQDQQIVFINDGVTFHPQ